MKKSEINIRIIVHYVCVSSLWDVQFDKTNEPTRDKINLTCEWAFSYSYLFFIFFYPTIISNDKIAHKLIAHKFHLQARQFQRIITLFILMYIYAFFGTVTGLMDNTGTWIAREINFHFVLVSLAASKWLSAKFNVHSIECSYPTSKQRRK